MAFQTYDKVVDAAGTGDHTAIQDAVNALGTGGGSIFVRGGTYTESVVVADSTSNLEIHLAVDAIVKAVGANEPFEIGANCDNINLRGGIFKGISAAQDGIKVGAGSRVKLVDVLIGSTSAADKVAKGIVAAGADVTYRGVRIISPTGVGIETAASSSEHVFDDVMIFDAGGHGIEMLASAARVVVANVVVKNAAGDGIKVRASSGSIIGNLVSNPTGNGINLVSSTYLAVTGNQIYSPGGYGITGDASTKATYCTVVGNPIYDATSGETANLDGTGMVVRANNTSDDPSSAHNRLHTMTNVSDHSAGNWKVFYSNGSGQMQELALPAANQLLVSGGAAAAPAWSATLAGLTLTSPTVNTPTISGGTIDGAVIGGSSAAAGSFTTVAASTQVQAPTGSASAPGYAFSSDTDTGLFLTTEAGSPSVALIASGVVTFKGKAVASAVNYLFAQPAATGSPPILAAGGSDTNVGMVFSTQAAGAYTFYSNGQVHFAIDTITSGTTNYPAVAAGGTGSGVQFYAAGGDSNINAYLRGKGTGGVLLTNGSLELGLAVNADASSVNYVQIQGRATGSVPYITAAGSDSNISLDVMAKGSGGAVRFFVNSAFKGQFDSSRLYLDNGLYIELGEGSAPGAPGSDRVRIYAEDNGSGKTRLMALFPTGAAQQIAIEP